MPDNILELFENGICIKCGGADVECLEDCTEHRCIDCGYIPEQDYFFKTFNLFYTRYRFYGGLNGSRGI